MQASNNISVDSRLYPSRFSSRFYPLSTLRKQLNGIIEKHLGSKNCLRLVDFGCGSMCYKPLFASYITEYTGVDLPGNRLAQFDVLPSGETTLPDRCADVVLSTQVLEHVVNPSIYLLECRRLLKPDGLLILSTHGYWMFHPVPTDYWRWTGHGLRKVLEDSGFVVTDIRGIMGLSSSGLQLFQDGFSHKIPRFCRNLFYAIMQSLIELLDRSQGAESKTEDAGIYVVVASRKAGA